MQHPVIAADGHTYEKEALQQWLQCSQLSPTTGQKLAHIRLTPNLLIKSALTRYEARLGWHAYEWGLACSLDSLTP